ncbi:hypothetical protein ATPR_0888 [Acetobacter tropicalis NBRC 101654]|uniref:Uncharacterized protein n=1 Tax=Acetobacter tropicalis NBRC 101654 TaxID=749388 RepID=F7VBY9_9PROT|nr:hypothetical protein ATPR_0888 [Acetobacter tropicalis NBRC 101654]
MAVNSLLPDQCLAKSVKLNAFEFSALSSLERLSCFSGSSSLENL